MMPDELYDLYRFVLEDGWNLKQHELTVFISDPEADDEPAVIYLQRFTYERKVATKAKTKKRKQR